MPMQRMPLPVIYGQVLRLDRSLHPPGMLVLRSGGISWARSLHAIRGARQAFALDCGLRLSISVPAMAHTREESGLNPWVKAAGGTGLHPLLPSARGLEAFLARLRE